jgi:3-methylcrotonyl-CoA carboxylase alpha subunit
MLFASSPRPLRSVLIANRGEIALRIMRTCARLGLRTIAVYSDADAEAAHVAAADEAVRIGRAPARESYLDIDAIILAARATGADAIHPGYGFLSENADFARRCDREGLIYIGPSAEAIGRMGSKIESKRIAERVGIPVVPGYHGYAQDPESLTAAAARIGYPVLIKASAGGGGRGMRRVDRAEGFAAALAVARSEAEMAFGDGKVLLEKFIAGPRHLEVQIVGDRLGNLVHLFERDCSVQRNNQKVLEEAPAPNLPDHVRQALYTAALELCRAIGYDSAGTVEFIMEAGAEEPYFLEMNTRLQVEHPVTEMVTGIDLVEWQLLVAAGEPLPLAQRDIRVSGHAIEARITAERADRDFQPVTGRLVAVDPPRGVRFDSGVVAGSTVSVYYDSLLAKINACGGDRATSVRRLAAGLEQLTLLGIPTTQAFLRDCLLHPLFATGPVTTGFIAKAFPGGWSVDPLELRIMRAVAAAYWLSPKPSQTSDDNADGWKNPWTTRGALRVTGSVRPATSDLLLVDDHGEVELQVRHGRSGFSVAIEGETVELGHLARKNGCLIIDAAHGPEVIGVHRRDDGVAIARSGLAISARIALKVDIRHDHGHFDLGGNALAAPLHGLISEIYVAKGDAVAAGDSILQMEAMKLIHTLKAPASGTVAAIHCSPGQTVPAGAVLVEINVDDEKEDD